MVSVDEGNQELWVDEASSEGEVVVALGDPGRRKRSQLVQSSQSSKKSYSVVCWVWLCELDVGWVCFSAGLAFCFRAGLVSAACLACTHSTAWA